LIVAVKPEPAFVVRTVNVAVVLPARTVTVLRVVADVRLLERLTTNPPGGAMELIVTVPVLVLPAKTDAGFSVTDTSVGAVIVSDAVFDAVPVLAVTVAVVCSLTPVVLTVNVAEV
jgi:hypothetical protein